MTDSPRILIVTSGSLSRNPRPAKEAATLAQAGYRVTVLRPSEGEHYDQLDRELKGDSGYRDEWIQPDSGAGSRVLRRLQRWIAVRLLPLGIEHPAALGAGTRLLERARKLPAELTIVHNETALWAGMHLMREGRKVAADIEDWYSEDLEEQDRRHRPLKLLRQLETSMLHHAAYVSTTSRSMSSALHERFGGNPAEVITNSFPLQPRPRNQHLNVENAPAFFWFSQTIGAGRGLEDFVLAWTRMSVPSRLVLLGRPSPGYLDTLLGGLSEIQRSRVEVLGLVSPIALPETIARHDIGLALEKTRPPSRNHTICNKILQYLNAGLAVVATPSAGQREVFASSPDIGLLADSHDSSTFARSLDVLVSNRDRLNHCQFASRRLAEEQYCWEVETPRLLALVQGALSTPAACIP